MMQAVNENHYCLLTDHDASPCTHLGVVTALPERLSGEDLRTATQARLPVSPRWNGIRFGGDEDSPQEV